MKRKAIFIVFMLLLMSIAYAREVVLPKNPGINQADSEIIIPQGEDATLSLPLFSRSYIRIYEGSRLNFNVVDPDNGVILIRNSMIIQDINRESTAILLSLDNSQYEAFVLNGGEEEKLNYSYKFMPFMFVTQIISHYESDSDKRNIVLYFNVPFIKAGKNLQDLPASGFVAIDPSLVKATTNNEEKFDPVLILMIALIILLVIAIVYFGFKKFNK